ncbi:MAG TPA: sigma-70 family RNA polymerase sigma factor [Gaiellaceae bacterium]|jgi:RNA polymerase sigma-70 factor (ECF subfamily)
MADDATTTADVRRLVERAQQGDRQALEELYLTHFDRIYSYLQMSVGNRHDAEDLTNQTFVKMLESIDRFEWRKVPISAWLFRIAHNLAMDLFRSRRRWQPEEEPPEPPGDEARSAEEEALQSIGRQSMLAMIQGLSQDQQQVLTLKFVFNFPNGDVATILGKTEGAIKSLQHRALASLQRQLTKA